MSAGSWYAGNAVRDGEDHRGWIVGHFMNGDDVRQSGGVEIKWGIHASGEERADWQADETSHHGAVARERQIPRRPLRGQLRPRAGRRLRDVGPGDRTLLAGRGGLGRGHGEMAVRASMRSFELSSWKERNGHCSGVGSQIL